MWYLRLIFVSLLVPASLPAADLASAIRREAGKCAAAWQRADYAGILAYLPPPVIRRSGGPAAALREIKDHFAQAREWGVDQLEAVAGPPTPVKTIGRWLTTMVPVTVVLHGPHVDLTQRTHVLGLSSDQGRRWYFVPLYETTQAELNAWFPEFGGRLVVPADPAPKVEMVF